MQVEWLDQHSWIALGIVVASAGVIIAAVFWPEPKYKPRILRLPDGRWACVSKDGVTGTGATPEQAYERWKE